MMDPSHCKSIETGKRNSMLSPIQSDTKSNEFSIEFGAENERNDSQIDFGNLTVDVDQTNKQIVVEVSMSMSLTQNMHQSANQSLDASTCGAIMEDTYVKTPGNTRLTRNSINTSVSSTEINRNFYKSFEAINNDSVKRYTPTVAKRSDFEPERTPIGVIRLRKVTPKIETPEISISDDETYEIIVVNKSQQMCAEHCDSVNSTINEFESSISLAINYPMMLENSTIATKSTANAHPFPFSPRIILHRINSIDEYHRSVSTQETPIVNKNKRKPRQAKVVSTKKGTYHEQFNNNFLHVFIQSIPIIQIAPPKVYYRNRNAPKMFCIF